MDAYDLHIKELKHEHYCKNIDTYRAKSRAYYAENKETIAKKAKTRRYKDIFKTSSIKYHDAIKKRIPLYPVNDVLERFPL